MLAAARKRTVGDDRIELIEHDLAEPLPTLGRFDAVVSSFAIHHLEHERKRSLYGEVFDLLEPGGVFANFEHVASPNNRLHVTFFAAIEEPIENEDPSDRLLDVEAQLRWLRELGFDDVDGAPPRRQAKGGPLNRIAYPAGVQGKAWESFSTVPSEN
jgi:SAM-dependent methyltransferase